MGLGAGAYSRQSTVLLMIRGVDEELSGPCHRKFDMSRRLPAGWDRSGGTRLPGCRSFSRQRSGRASRFASFTRSGSSSVIMASGSPARCLRRGRRFPTARMLSAPWRIGVVAWVSSPMIISAKRADRHISSRKSGSRRRPAVVISTRPPRVGSCAAPPPYRCSSLAGAC
jgi:hypothetical protein